MIKKVGFIYICKKKKEKKSSNEEEKERKGRREGNSLKTLVSQKIVKGIKRIMKSLDQVVYRFSAN